MDIKGLDYKPAKIYYVNGKLMPIFRALMLPHIGILIKKKHKGDDALLIHEQVHWMQYKRMGSLIFCLRYIFQLIFIGYDTMPLELEARQAEENPWNYRQLKWYKRKPKFYDSITRRNTENK